MLMMTLLLLSSSSAASDVFSSAMYLGCALHCIALAHRHRHTNGKTAIASARALAAMRNGRCRAMPCLWLHENAAGDDDEDDDDGHHSFVGVVKPWKCHLRRVGWLIIGKLGWDQ